MLSKSIYIFKLKTETQVIIGTEFVVPLAIHLKTARDNNLINLGMYKLANALKFLTQDCAMIHGLVRISSVFVTPAGEWK